MTLVVIMGFLVVEGVFLLAREEDGSSEAMTLARGEKCRPSRRQPTLYRAPPGGDEAPRENAVRASHFRPHAVVSSERCRPLGCPSCSSALCGSGPRSAEPTRAVGPLPVEHQIGEQPRGSGRMAKRPDKPGGGGIK